MTIQAEFAIAIMTRPVIAGATKTRLIERFGADAAAAMHLEMLEATIAHAKSATQQVVLFVNDDLNHSSIQTLCQRHGIRAQLQVGQNLGEKMRQVFLSLHTQRERVVLVGSDCLTHSAQRFVQAANALSQYNIVFGPAQDGGYVLVAAKVPVPPVFDGVDWGTAQVMAQTRAKLDKLGQGYFELETTWDVDEPADVERAVQWGYFQWLNLPSAR
jgi:uncharacterized protein